MSYELLKNIEAKNEVEALKILARKDKSLETKAVYKRINKKEDDLKGSLLYFAIYY